MNNSTETKVSIFNNGYLVKTVNLTDIASINLNESTKHAYFEVNNNHIVYISRGHITKYSSKIVDCLEDNNNFEEGTYYRVSEIKDRKTSTKKFQSLEKLINYINKIK
jgi:hypothetical protein